MMAPISHEIIYYKYGWDRINVTTQKKSSLEQSSSLHNQINDIINPKYLKNVEEFKISSRMAKRWNETHRPANSSQGGGLGILNMNI